MSADVSNIRPEPDKILVDIADYAANYRRDEPRGDRHGALQFDRHPRSAVCSRCAIPNAPSISGPVVPGATLPNGARVPGTDWQLDPVHAAFNIGAMIRWLDFNDTWLAAEWGHPSDNLGGILALADYLTRAKQKSFTVADVLAGDDQGARDSRHSRAGEQLQPRRPRSCAAGHASPPAPWPRPCSAATRNKSSARYPTPGPTAAPCASIAMRPTPGRANPGPPAMPPAAACVWR